MTIKSMVDGTYFEFERESESESELFESKLNQSEDFIQQLKLSSKFEFIM